VISVFHQVGNAAVWVALAASVLFCIGYAVLAPWRSSAEGKHLMMFTAVIGVAFAWIAYRQVISSAPPAALSIEVPRAVILSALAAGLVWRLALLIRNQVWGRRQ
jgi:hypothetical protein